MLTRVLNAFMPYARHWSPRKCGDGRYHFDLDGALRYERPKTGIDSWPYPSISGTISGFMPMMDGVALVLAQGKNLTGPGVQTPSTNPTTVSFPMLTKQTA